MAYEDDHQILDYSLWSINNTKPYILKHAYELYRVSQEERTKLQEGVPYVKL